MKRFLCALLVACLLGRAHASDHADPVDLKQLEAGITDLFVFPDHDQLIVILNVRRSLTTDVPLPLKDYVYSINMDLHSAVGFDNPADKARYGGTVRSPGDIKPDVTIDLQLNDDATLKSKSFHGLRNDASIRLYTGVRDDPFIQPRFFGSNIVAMVLAIPFSSFPDNQQDWLVWGTSKKGNEQIDHVGRSLRTMLPRLDSLNTLPPSAHVAELKRLHEHPTLVEDIKRTFISPLFALKDYDFMPDVMIYSRRFPVGYPNGRLLTDDVAALAMQNGDALLWEDSFSSLKGAPRPTKNDKPFLSEFPYLADPWPVSMVRLPPALTQASVLKLWAIGIAAVLLLIAENVLVVWLVRRLRPQKIAIAATEAVVAVEAASD